MWFAVSVRLLRRELLTIGLLLVAACGRAPGLEKKVDKALRPAHHARSVAARMAALRMDHARVHGLLGAHRYRAKHRVRVTVNGQPDHAFEDRYVLRCAGKSDCYGRQDNSLEYGVEFYRIGEHTYFRHRYQRFMRFTEEPEEARRRLERIWGAGEAVIELLQAYLVTTPAGEASVAGRSGSRYKLSLGRGRPALYTGRRSWRARCKAMRIEGEAVLDKSTGVVLALRVSYAVSAPKGGRTVTITGDFDGAVVEVGKAQVVKAPADFAVARSRPRETQELRMLGSQRLNPGWFRGGGPQAARRGHSGGGMGPASTHPRRSRPRAAAPVMRRAPRARPSMARPPADRRRPAGKP